jgi:cytochrome c553
MKSKLLALAGVAIIITAYLFLPWPRSERHPANDPADDKWTYEDLKSLIETKKIKSIDDLIKELPESMRTNYVLVYSSLSLQPATPENPRVILSTFDGRLTCAYAKGATVECFQFRDPTRSFEFREIRFPEKADAARPVLFSEINKSTDGSVSCTTCHGRDPRPNWEGYPFWKGLYGSQDDLINPEIKQNYLDHLGDDFRPTEAKNYVQFWQQAGPRYQSLIRDENDPYAPYLHREKGDIAERPNLNFSHQLMRLMGLRNARLLEENFSQAEQFQFLRAFAHCDGEDDEVAKLLSTKFAQTEWTTYYQATDPDCGQCTAEHVVPGTTTPTEVGDYGASPISFNYFGGYGNEDGNQDYPKNYVMMNSFVAEVLAQDLSALENTVLKKYTLREIPFEKKLLSIYKYSASPLNLKRIAALDQLYPINIKAVNEDKSKFCHHLKQNIEDAPETKSPAHQRDYSVSFASTCLKCHAHAETQASLFPLDDPQKLKPLIPKMVKRLQSQSSPMPPQGLLKEEERIVLLRYLESLGSAEPLKK